MGARTVLEKLIVERRPAATVASSMRLARWRAGWQTPPSPAESDMATMRVRTDTAAAGPVVVSAANRRYFAAASSDGGERVVYLTGSHIWNNLHDGWVPMGPGADVVGALERGRTAVVARLRLVTGRRLNTRQSRVELREHGRWRLTSTAPLRTDESARYRWRSQTVTLAHLLADSMCDAWAGKRSRRAIGRSLVRPSTFVNGNGSSTQSIAGSLTYTVPDLSSSVVASAATRRRGSPRVPPPRPVDPAGTCRRHRLRCGSRGEPRRGTAELRRVARRDQRSQ